MFSSIIHTVSGKGTGTQAHCSPVPDAKGTGWLAVNAHGD